TLAVALRNTDQIKRWIFDHFASVGDGDGHGNGTREAQPSAIGNGARLGFHQKRTIFVYPASRHLIDNAYLRRQLHQVAITALRNLANATTSPKSGMPMPVN